MKQATLLFLLRENEILLAMKKRGFGSGKWNGVGGKVEPGESIVQATIRECEEEIKVFAIDIVEIAKLNFYFPDLTQNNNQTVSVFKCLNWEGKPEETEEMSPKWFDLKDIPYGLMWSDDKLWLPQILTGNYVTGDFFFDNNDELIKYNLN
jgi:8-oxo-dGTP pyrophosphatase MutT (NUDIX family)